MTAANLARAGILLLWVGLPPAVAHAGDLTTRGAGLSADRTYCVGTLDVTRDTPPVVHTGDLAIRSVDTAAGCDGYCGDGVVNGLEECDWADNTPECTSNCRILRFREYGGTSPYLDDFRDLQACRNTPPRVPDNVGHRDVTFLAFGDTQYGNNDAQAQPPILAPGIKNNRPDMNRRHIEALNRAEELSWPSGFEGAGQPLRDVRGVIIAGDVAQEGGACTVVDSAGRSCWWFTNVAERDSWFVNQPQDHRYTEWAQFRDEYGLCGDKRLKLPVFEGAGNHDYFRDMGEEFEHPIHKYIAYRNNFRRGVDRVDPAAKGHYSWTWDDVHFVQLNVAAKDDTIVSTVKTDDPIPAVLATTKMKPYSALTFLKRDLALHAAAGQPVVLIQHYPWVDSARFDAAARRALFSVIKDYNVVALVHGHTHGSAFRQWSPCDDVDPSTSCLTALGVSSPPKAYPVFDAGNPFYGNGRNKVHTASGSRKYGHYAALRITDSYLEAATVSWRFAGSLCDFADAASCNGASGCAWSRAEAACRSDTEMCLPGVTTQGCDPAEGPCALTEGTGEGGWAVKVRLSDRAIVQTFQRPLHQYCPGS